MEYLSVQKSGNLLVIFYFVELQNEMAKLKHRVQVAEEERELAVEREKETKLRVNYIDYMEFIYVS